MAVGTTGTCIVSLQTWMNSVMNTNLVVGGRLGPQTKRAVQIFQGRFGLRKDGRFGESSRTWSGTARSWRSTDEQVDSENLHHLRRRRKAQSDFVQLLKPPTLVRTDAPDQRSQDFVGGNECELRASGPKG